MRIECKYCLKMIHLDHYKRHLKEFHKLRPLLVDEGKEIVAELNHALLADTQERG